MQTSKESSRDEMEDRSKGNELQAIVSNIDFNNMASIIRRTLLSQENTKDHQEGEQEEVNSHSGIVEEEGKERQEDDKETPKFGQQALEEEKGAEDDDDKDPEMQQLNISALREQIQTIEEGKRPKFHKIDLSKRTIDQIPSKFKFYSQNSVKMDIEISKIQNLPLYGIDHVKNFFECHEILSERLKIEQALVVYFSDNNSISPESFSKGIEISENIKFSGPELTEVLSIVFLTTFRKIQEFIVTVCKKQIVRIENKDIEIAFPFLFNAKSTFGDSHLTTLIAMMRQAFDLPSKPTQKDVLTFYALLLDIIDSKRQEEDLDFQYGDQQLQEQFHWDDKKQQRLCELYLRHKSVRGLLPEFNKTFDSKVSVCLLRVKLQKIAKNMLKHIECSLLKQDKQRQFAYYLNQKDYRMIARDPKAINLRKLLIKLYLQGHILVEDLKNIIDELGKVAEGRNAMATRQKFSDNHPSALKKTRKNHTEESNSVSSEEQESELSVEEHTPGPKKLKKLSQSQHPEKNQLTLRNSFQKSEGRSLTKSKNHILKSALGKNDLFKKKVQTRGQRSR